MKAVWFSSFGSAAEVLQFGEREVPSTQQGEVLVRIKASAINPSDTKKRQGAFADLLDRGSIIPNSDGAGIIESVGTGVCHSRIGQRVWIYQAQYQRTHGTAAEYLAIDHRRAIVLPDGNDSAVGACLGIPAMTAHRCVFADGGVENQLVLVTGGAGRVGFYAIQWAKIGGARVIATASNEADEGDCFAAGADYVVNHRNKHWNLQVLQHTAGEKIDRVIDVEFGANLPMVLKLVKEGAVIATYASSAVPEPRLPFKQMMFMDLTIRLVIVYAMPEAAKRQATEAITHALEQNMLQHRYCCYAFEQFVAASEAVEHGKRRGCVVVRI